MKRRDFIKYSALGSIPFLLNGQGIVALGQDLFRSALYSMRPDRKLVMVQLNGGNDGLNTFIPLDQFGNLQKARPNIIIPENKLLSLTDTVGLHPAMTGIRQLFQDEKFLLLQNVGYPEPNLSHFRSKDIITSGSASDVILSTGWMGRMQNAIHPDYPDGYPNEIYPHPVALSIGSNASPTCQGYTNNLSSVIKNLDTAYNSPGSPDSFPDTPFGDELKYVAGIMEQTELYLEAITEAAGKANNLSSMYPETVNSLADQLKIVARMIAGGLQTQVYVVSLGGWDTHAGQTEDGVPEGGRHRELLTLLSEALVAFQDDLELLGVADDVIGLVFSEFGRRIQSNDSFGTDHGTAWPAMMFGSMINPMVLGPNPVIPEQVDKNTNLSMNFDFRSLYASIFREWFETDEASIEEVLQGSFEYLPILKEDTTGMVKERGSANIVLYPNPVREHARLKFDAPGGKVRLEVHDSSGRRMKILSEKEMAAGPQELNLNLAFLSPGSFYLGLITSDGRSTIPFIRR